MLTAYISSNISASVDEASKKLSKVNIERTLINIGLLVLLFLLVDSCFASNTTAMAGSGTGTTVNDAKDDFNFLLDTLTGWISGALGKALALLAFLIGLFMGAIQQQYMKAIGGIGIAIAIAIVPSIMNSLIGAGI